MKKIKLTTVAAILGVALFCVTGCKEVDEVIKDADNSKTISKAEVENPSNEYDYYGEAHNKTLAFLGEKYGSKLKDTPIDELKTAVSDYAVSQGAAKLGKDDFKVVDQIVACNKDGGVTGDCIKGPFCILFPRKCEFINDLMKEWNSKTLSSKEATLSFIAHVKKTEENVPEEKGCPNCRSNGLKALSIARWGPMYFSNENENPSGSVWSNELKSLESFGNVVVIAGAVGGTDGPYSAGLASALTLVCVK